MSIKTRKSNGQGHTFKVGDLVGGFINSINRAQQDQAISLHILTQGEFVFAGIVLGIEKDFMGEHIDVGKDGQILIQGHRKLSTRVTLKNKNLIDE